MKPLNIENTNTKYKEVGIKYNMKIVKEKYHYEIQLNTDNDVNLLSTLKDEKHVNYIDKGVNVIYIYSLVDSSIPYPNKEGKMLYIGESCKCANPTGLRFSQHITSKSDEGKNANINYALHRYYWNGFKIAVDIFDIGDDLKERRKEIERDLIESHVKIYGALPIAQGASGLLVSSMSRVDESKAEEFFRYD